MSENKVFQVVTANRVKKERSVKWVNLAFRVSKVFRVIPAHVRTASWNRLHRIVIIDRHSSLDGPPGFPGDIG